MAIMMWMVMVMMNIMTVMIGMIVIKTKSATITTATNALAKLYSTLAKRPSKIGLLEGYILSCGGPMVTDGQYTSPSHRRGGLRPNNMYYDDFRKALLVFTNLE